MPTVNGVVFRVCPHCGDQPDVSTTGTFVDVECCASMSFQKSDMLTLQERQTWNAHTYHYHPVAEDKVLRIVAALWNKRYDWHDDN